MEGLWRVPSTVLAEMCGDRNTFPAVAHSHVAMACSTASPMTCLSRRVEGASISNENSAPLLQTPRRRLSMSTALASPPAVLQPAADAHTRALFSPQEMYTADQSCNMHAPETPIFRQKSRAVLEDGIVDEQSAIHGIRRPARSFDEATHSPSSASMRPIRRTISSPAAPLLRANSSKKRRNSSFHGTCAVAQNVSFDGDSDSAASLMDEAQDAVESPKRKRSVSVNEPVRAAADPLAHSWHGFHALKDRPHANPKRRATPIPILDEECEADKSRIRRHCSWTGASQRPTPQAMECDDDLSAEAEETDAAENARSLAAPPDNPEFYNRGDGERCQLPIVTGKHPDLKSITPDTVLAIFRGQFRHKFDRVIIVDCRFGYEYEGGHIRDAVNCATQTQIEELFLRRPIVEHRVAIIFHCEFSSSRGPKLLRFLRQEDRRIHYERGIYPNLFYPELYILNGGYKSFFHQYPDECEPRAYVPMKAKEFKGAMQKGIRETKNARSKPPTEPARLDLC